MIDQAEKMSWPKAERDNFIRRLLELQLEMGNRFRREMPPSTYISVSEPTVAAIEQLRTKAGMKVVDTLVEGIQRLQTQGATPEYGAPKTEEQPARRNKSAITRRPRRTQAS